MLKLFILSLLGLVNSQTDLEKTCNWATVYMGEKAPGLYLDRIPVLVGTGEKPGPCITTYIDGVTESYRLACIPTSTGLTQKRLYSTSCGGAPYTFTMVDVMDNTPSMNGWGSSISQGAYADPSTYNCNAREGRTCQYARLKLEADDTPNCTYSSDWISVPLIAEQKNLETNINGQLNNGGSYSYSLGDYNVVCNGSQSMRYAPQLQRRPTTTYFANLTASGCDYMTYPTGGGFDQTTFGRMAAPETGDQESSTSVCNMWTYMGTDVIPSMINAAPTSAVSMPTCNPAIDACDRTDFSVKYPVVAGGSASNQYQLCIFVVLAIFGLHLN